MSENYLNYEPEVLKKVQEVSIEIFKEFKRICEENNLKYFVLFGSAIGAVRHKGFIPWDDDLDVGMFRDDFEVFLEICKNMKDSNYEIMSVLIDKEHSSTVTKFQKKGTKFVGYHARYFKCNLGLAIDIFPLDVVPEDKALRQKQMRKAYIYEKLMFLRKNPFPYLPMSGIKKGGAQVICCIAWFFLNLFRVKSKWLYKKFDEAAQMYRNLDSKYITCMIAPVKSDYYWKLEGMLPAIEVPFCDTICMLPGNNHDILTLTYGDYMELPPEDKRANHAPMILDFGER